MRSRWHAFQILSLLIACVLAALTWDRDAKWSAQPLLVPIWIAITPLLLRHAFLAAQPRLVNDEWRRKTAVVIIGIAFAELLNFTMGYLRMIPWSLALTIIFGSALLQVGAFILYRWRGTTRYNISSGGGKGTS